MVDSSVAHVVLSNVFKARKMLWQGRPAEGPSINNVVNSEREGVQNDLEIYQQIYNQKSANTAKGGMKKL